MTSFDDEKRRIEQEARLRRGADLTGALLGRDGGAHLRGASPTPILQRASLEVDQWLRDHLAAPDASLRHVLLRHLAANPDQLAAALGHPDRLLATWLPPLLAAPDRLADLVREVDMEWGHLNQERPHFERPDRPADPDDPYTVAGVTATLTALLARAQGSR